jgi:hypothetical protein
VAGAAVICCGTEPLGISKPCGSNKS